MNRTISQTAKILALLAVLMLPVQWSMAATCCNSQLQADCCEAVCSIRCSCGVPGQNGSGSNPYQYPIGCCVLDAPIADDSTIDPSVLANEGVFAAATLNSIVGADDTTSKFVTSADFRASTSGSSRCVLLCRFRL